MLESLFKGTGTIHELNMEGAFPEPKLYRPREKYEALKATVLYDNKSGQWNWSMSEEQLLLNTQRYADTQLLGVLAEAQFNHQAARGLYDRLKQTPLYDAKRGQWNLSMSKGKVLQRSDRSAACQLLGVLVEAEFDRQAARVIFERLKQTALFDVNFSQWNERMTSWQGPMNPTRLAKNQLLGILAENRFETSAGRGLFNRLKQTPLWDSGQAQWNESMSKEQILGNTDRYSVTQLLGVLAEAQFDHQAARVLFEGLKQTPLFDTKYSQWSESMAPEPELSTTYRCASAQLLAVLVEAKLLETLPPSPVKEIPPLPVTRSW